MRSSVPTARITVDEKLIEMQVGETRELKATVIPLFASSTNKLTPSEVQNAALLSMLVTDKIEWTSSDAEIVAVDENGIITALKEGTVKITAKSGEHEIICNILVNVPIPEWASEEFLEYIERIGAYTELPLGTDGSAGPTAQYVTFGFVLSDEEMTHFSQPPDKRTLTTYKGIGYKKGEDDEWYCDAMLSYCNGFCRQMNFEEHSQYADTYTYEYIDYEHDPDNPRGDIKVTKTGTKFENIPTGYRIAPRKWRLLDKEKGLMVMEDYSRYWSKLEISDTIKFSNFDKYNDNYTYFYSYKYYKDHTKSEIEKQTTLCDYETSYLRAWLDGGYYYEYIDLWKVKSYNIPGDPDSGVKEWEVDDNGKHVLHSIDRQKYCMNTTNYFRNKVYSEPKPFNFEPYFTEKQFTQIKEVDLDCGEGGSVKGRLFILSEDEIRKYYSKGEKIINEKYYSTYYDSQYYDYSIFYTRTRKKNSDGKNTLCAVKINHDGTVDEFVQLEGYDTGDYHYFIPAICVAPAPQK